MILAASSPTPYSWALLLLALGMGLAIGYLRGGRLSLIRVPWPVVAGAVVGLLVQVGASWLPRAWLSYDGRLAVLALTYVLAIAPVAFALVVLYGRRLPRLAALALTLIFVGWLLNGLAIGTNGGMPVSRQSLRDAGYPPQQHVSAFGDSLKHVVAYRSTHLRYLEDFVVVRPLHAVYSIGDFVLLGGIGLFFAASMTGAFGESKRRAVRRATALADA